MTEEQELHWCAQMTGRRIISAEVDPEDGILILLLGADGDSRPKLMLRCQTTNVYEWVPIR